MSSSLTSAGVAGRGHLVDDEQQLVAGGDVVAVEDLAGRGPLDRLAGEVHVADVVRGHVDDEQPAIADGDEQPLLGEALHPLPQRPAADPELAGQVGLAELGPGLSSPWPMARRSLSAMMLGVDSWTSGPMKLVIGDLRTACPARQRRAPGRAVPGPSRPSPGWR